MINPASCVWTPLHIKLLIHYYAMPCTEDWLVSTAAINYTKQLEGMDLVTYTEPQNNNYPGWRTTGRGEKLLEMILQTPAPILKYVDPREVTN